MGKVALALGVLLGLGVTEARATVHYLCADGTILTIRYMGLEVHERARLEALHPCIGAYHRALESKAALKSAETRARKRRAFFPEGR